MNKNLIRLLSPVILVAGLSSCRASTVTPAEGWEWYRNSRFGFEFPYPNTWITETAPANRDGQVFQDPQNSGVEIRGWASYELSDLPSKPSRNPAKPLPPIFKPHFTTEQGLPGELKVELGPEMSTLTLTLVQKEVRYNWQGSAPSQQFADYYKFFYYVAGQYRISEPPKQP